jgi:uncharacterized membrane-anchored protein
MIIGYIIGMILLAARYYAINRGADRKQAYSRYAGLTAKHYAVYSLGLLAWPVLFPVYLLGILGDKISRVLPASTLLIPVVVLLITLDLIYITLIKIYL